MDYFETTALLASCVGLICGYRIKSKKQLVLLLVLIVFVSGITQATPFVRARNVDAMWALGCLFVVSLNSISVMIAALFGVLSRYMVNKFSARR